MVADNKNEELEPDYIFKRKTSEYEINLQPITNYVKQAAKFLSTKYDLPYKEAVKEVKGILKDNKIKNPTVKFKHRHDNGDVHIEEEKLTDYIKDVLNEGEVLVPSFTAYIHPSKKKSLHADFLAINISKRKQDKKLAFKYKQEGNKDKYMYHNTLQKVRKIFNNSLSGAYASVSTGLFNPSAHYTLTSITRSVASIGNAISESFIAGNKHFRSPEIVMNYITAILTEVSEKDIEFVILKYKLHQPTAEEVMDMIIYSSKHYWRDETKEKEILEYLKTLNGYQLSSVMYVNDLHHLKKYNEEFVKTMLTKMAMKVKNGVNKPLEIIARAPEGIMNLVHHICSDEIKGMNVSDYSKLDDELLDMLGSTANNIVKTMIEYGKLYRTFYTTNILPIGISYIKEMMRDTIVLSDTDSTCASYDKWVEWYFGEPKFSSKAIALAASVMTINTQIMDHNIKIFAKNMNIEDQLVELLKMKNEFYWPVFITANVSKHYYADTFIQEGNVFKETDLEQKGVHLIASAVDQNIVKRLQQMMKDIHKDVKEKKEIVLRDYVKKIADMERELLDLIKSGDINIYKKEKIKEAAAYKLSKEKSPYINHMLWEYVFKDKYGSPGEPQYMVIKVPVDLDSKAKTTEFLKNIKDRDIAEKLESFMKKYGKDKMTTFRLPIAIIGSIGVIEEIIPVINSKRIVMDNLNMGYMILESLGFYRKPSRLISEMGY